MDEVRDGMGCETRRDETRRDDGLGWVGIDETRRERRDDEIDEMRSNDKDETMGWMRVHEWLFAGVVAIAVAVLILTARIVIIRDVFDLSVMQNPNEDTEWNDILRAKGIIPEKEVTEADLTTMIDEAAQKQIAKQQGKKDLADMNLEELNEVEDDEDEKIWQEYRAQRLAELRQQQQRSRFGSVEEITVRQLFSDASISETRTCNRRTPFFSYIFIENLCSNRICRRLQHIMQELASKARSLSEICHAFILDILLCYHSGKFPATKFLQSISTRCIPNYPDKNLPTVFIYYENDLKKQFAGSHVFGGESMTLEGVEWALAQVGAVESDIEDPRDTVLSRTINDLRVGKARVNDSASENDSDSD
eukprot:gene4052-6472_t